MSTDVDSSESKSERETLRELALSDRDSAPLYREMYRRDYGVDPEEDTDD